MTAPALQINHDPGIVWRVGFAPRPWAWTPWVYATDAGLFNGRWDDQLGAFRTLYTSSSLVGCFLELLAKFRPDEITVLALDDIDDPDGLDELFPGAPTGTVGYDWLQNRRYGRATQTGKYCFVTHSESVAALVRARVFAARGYSARMVDAALLKDAGDRALTRSIARWLYNRRADDRSDLVDGIELRSRFGDEIAMWAVFERAGDSSTSRHLAPTATSPVRPDPAALSAALEQLGLRWPDES